MICLKCHSIQPWSHIRERDVAIHYSGRILMSPFDVSVVCRLHAPSALDTIGLSKKCGRTMQFFAESKSQILFGYRVLVSRAKTSYRNGLVPCATIVF
jgi:hypothetical protein